MLIYSDLQGHGEVRQWDYSIGPFGWPISVFVNNWLAKKGYYRCPVAGHDKKPGLKGETSDELIFCFKSLWL